MTERSPAFVVAHQTEKRLKTETARLVKGRKDSLDCFQLWMKQKKTLLTLHNTIDRAIFSKSHLCRNKKDFTPFRFCLQFAFYDRKKSRFHFFELLAEPMKGGRKHPNLSVAAVSVLVKRVVRGTGEERVRDRRKDRQMD